MGVGTVSYASPEQIDGLEVDIFALGMILLELFSNFTSEREQSKAFHNCCHCRELEQWMHRTYHLSEGIGTCSCMYSTQMENGVDVPRQVTFVILVCFAKEGAAWNYSEPS